MEIISYTFRIMLLPFLFIVYCGFAFVIIPFMLMIIVMGSLEGLSNIHTECGMEYIKSVLIAFIAPVVMPFYFSYVWLTEGKLTPDGL